MLNNYVIVKNHALSHICEEKDTLSIMTREQYQKNILWSFEPVAGRETIKDALETLDYIKEVGVDTFFSLVMKEAGTNAI